MWQLNGFFERLISFMEFENAAYALIDEDQQDAVKALLDKLADFYITLFDESLKHFPQIDGFFVHDDWGSQRSPFFSPAIAKELIVPSMKKVTDYIHSRGRYAELHSCGHLLQQVPNIIEAGWDIWCPQMLNDTHKIYDLYGDKLVIGVAPNQLSSDMAKPESKTEAEEIAAAESYAERFCNPRKPVFYNMYAGMALSPAYRAALYKASRMRYGG
jgi:uroporphyrinogen-III decarboxylase